MKKKKQKVSDDDKIIKENYIKPKVSRQEVRKISMALAKKAIAKEKPRYLKTAIRMDEKYFILEANLIRNIAKAYNPDFKTVLNEEEAVIVAAKVNEYMANDAKKAGEDHVEITPEIILKSFDRLRSVYRNLLLYFRGDDRSCYDLDKGIYIHGGTGSGKTLIMKVFKEYTKNRLQFNSFRKIESSLILDQVYKSGNRGGLNALDQFIRTPITYNPINIYIEDFGAGQKKVKWMGNDIEPMGELIMRRYRYFEKYGTLTHICTNIKPLNFSDHFGPRVCSRFSKMFNIVNLNLFDWRRI